MCGAEKLVPSRTAYWSPANSTSVEEMICAPGAEMSGFSLWSNAVNPADEKLVGTPGHVVGLVVRHVSWVLGIGMTVGLAGALAAARSMRGLLFGIEPWDPLSQGVTIALLCAVAVAAAWIPARRAMRVDPAAVLRE